MGVVVHVCPFIVEGSRTDALFLNFTIMSTNIDQLLAGFQEECWYDAEAFTLEAVPGMGIGAIAKRDLQVCLQ